MLSAMLDVVKGISNSYWTERAVSQIRYADRMSAVNDGRYDDLVNEACTTVIDGVKTDGVLTKSTAQTVEGILSPLSEMAKKYKVICAAHAHIDMNWMWSWDETVSITLETFRTMLNLMEEYPGYTFSQSQASVYRIVADYDPEMLEEIKARVKEGRWEVTASTWVETDKNIPNGESLARHILYTKRYLSELLGISSDSLCIDFEPDTFGHSANVPEILAKGGVKYYYHCRGYDGHTMYKWASPSGANVVVYREPIWYNASIEPTMALYAPEYCAKSGLDTMLKVYGVGDHGGGPTRRDIERILDMNTWPVFPEIKFGTFGEFFNLLEGIADKLPLVEGELNFVFDGCYTTQTRIKKGNRKSENMLADAELFSSLSSVYNNIPYPEVDYTKSWENVLFNHFHDIIPGSGTVDTREYAMGLYQTTMAIANTKRTKAYRDFAALVDTAGLVAKIAPEQAVISQSMSEGAGVGYGISDGKISQTSRGAGLTRVFHFFNASAYEREETVEVVLWDWNGDTSRLQVKDSQGQQTLHHVTGRGHNDYWGHSFVNVLVRVKVPSCGYATYVITQGEAKGSGLHFPGDPRVQVPGNYCLENSLVRVTFDPITCAVTSFVDKETGEELIDRSHEGASFRQIDEDASKGMTAWVVGKYMGAKAIASGARITGIQRGPDGIRSSISYQVAFGASRMDVTVKLDKESKFIDYDVRCDWREVGQPGNIVPQLAYWLPVSYHPTTFKYDVPFGVVQRPGFDLDVPANSWVLGERIDDGKKSLMLITDSKYGFRCVNGIIAVTLIRSSVDPDPTPEFGIHKFAFAVGAVDASQGNTPLINVAHGYNHPISVLSGSSHQGTEAPDMCLLKVEGDVVVSAVKAPENGKDLHNKSLVIRIYETEGKETKAVLSFNSTVKRAIIADINEKPVYSCDDSINTSNKLITFTAQPFTVNTIIVEF